VAYGKVFHPLAQNRIDLSIIRSSRQPAENVHQRRSCGALACMRSKSAHHVTVSISNDLTMGGKGVIFGPNVDGSVLPDTIMNLVRSGETESRASHRQIHGG
jgi:hypothetical protein